jgi:hypothetical protein
VLRLLDAQISNHKAYHVLEITTFNPNNFNTQIQGKKLSTALSKRLHLKELLLFLYVPVNPYIIIHG